MSSQQKMVYYVAGGTTVVAGILHVLMFPAVLDSAFYPAILFLISGIVQIFWALPMFRKWGTPWYYAGIGGTVVLIALWAATRVPNPVTGMGLPIDAKGLAIQTLEIAYVAVTALVLLSRRPRIEEEKAAT
jgi:hypothetical protein